MSDHDPDELINRYQLGERLQAGEFPDVKPLSRERLGQLAQRPDAPRPVNPRGRTKMYRLGDWLEYLRGMRSRPGPPPGRKHLQLTVPPGQAAEVAAVLDAGLQASDVSEAVRKRLAKWIGEARSLESSSS